jgi:hypothetical protein
MRTGRAIIISAVLALGAAAPVLASSAIATTAAGYAPAVQVQATAHGSPNVFYHT